MTLVFGTSDFRQATALGPNQRHGAQKAQVVAAPHEGGDGVERGRQFLDIPVGIDLEIHRCERVVLSAYRLNAIID